jgi:hypothetical protein
MVEAQLSFDAIEDYLGPAATRFFATGYRRPHHRIVDVHVTPPDDEDSGAEATVTVEYPRDWSKKTDEIDIPPHLSSVDMIVLGAQLCEAHLSHAYGLEAADRRQMRIRRVTLKAGTTPQEDLVDLPARATLRKTSAVSQDGDRFLSVYRCKIGVMRAGFEIEHGISQRATSRGSFGAVDEIIGPIADRYYGDGFRRGRHSIHDVRVDMDALRADASVQFDFTPKDRVLTDGIDSAGQPAVSVIDCFVVSLQMVQVLMYELDSLTREDSDTLWMLNTVLEAPEAQQPYSDATPAYAAITAKHLLELAGDAWRNVDIEGECGGVKLRCSFAHRLPKRPERATGLAPATS